MSLCLCIYANRFDGTGKRLVADTIFYKIKEKNNRR